MMRVGGVQGLLMWRVALWLCCITTLSRHTLSFQLFGHGTGFCPMKLVGSIVSPEPRLQTIYNGRPFEFDNKSLTGPHHDILHDWPRACIRLEI